MIERIKEILQKRAPINENAAQRIEDNGYIDPELPFTEGYWRQMHEKYQSLKELRKSKKCQLWAERATNVLEAYGYKEVFKTVTKTDMGIGTWLHDEFTIWEHQYLEALHAEKRYIADGTAGQFVDDESEFKEGYFGYLEDAPAVLKRVYTYNEDESGKVVIQRPDGSLIK